MRVTIEGKNLRRKRIKTIRNNRKRKEDKNKSGKKRSKKQILKATVNTTDLAESMTSVQKGSKPE
jgi:hypothetical protein